MTDGDIWGSGRLSRRWYAVEQQQRVELSAGGAITDERRDLTARALAEILRRIDRGPCEEFVRELLDPAAASIEQWHGRCERIVNEWGSREAELAQRAAAAVRARLSHDAPPESVRASFYSEFAARVCHFMEDKVAARIGCEGAKSVLTASQADHFARQLEGGPESRIRAPRRIVAKKSTREILDFEIPL
jgi:hypothetical protein